MMRVDLGRFMTAFYSMQRPMNTSGIQNLFTPQRSTKRNFLINTMKRSGNGIKELRSPERGLPKKANLANRGAASIRQRVDAIGPTLTQSWIDLTKKEEFTG